MKYDPLRTYLGATPSSVREVTLSFAQIETILGDSLPQSACDHRAWWANELGDSRHTQAEAWLRAGFTVDSVDQGSNPWVRFVRQHSAG